MAQPEVREAQRKAALDAAKERKAAQETKRASAKKVRSVDPPACLTHADRSCVEDDRAEGLEDAGEGASAIRSSKLTLQGAKGGR